MISLALMIQFFVMNWFEAEKFDVDHYWGLTDKFTEFY